MLETSHLPISSLIFICNKICNNGRSRYFLWVFVSWASFRY